MSTELSVHAVHQGGMRVLVGNGTHQVLMDYPMQQGEPAAGFTPLQMLLASLSACSADTVMHLLKNKFNQPVDGIEVETRASRTQKHPTVLTEIAMEFLVKGSGVSPQAVTSALQVSEEQLCPVWNMLKGGTPIQASFRIVGE
jgi:putative redox protein